MDDLFSCLTTRTRTNTVKELRDDHHVRVELCTDTTTNHTRTWDRVRHCTQNGYAGQYTHIAK